MTAPLPSSWDEAPSDLVADQLHGPRWPPSTSNQAGTHPYPIPPGLSLLPPYIQSLLDQTHPEKQTHRASLALPPLEGLVLRGLLLLSPRDSAWHPSSKKPSLTSLRSGHCYSAVRIHPPARYPAPAVVSKEGPHLFDAASHTPSTQQALSTCSAARRLPLPALPVTWLCPCLIRIRTG